MSKKEITLRDQLRKFGLTTILGYYTITIFGIGFLLGIFDYLYDKAQNLPDSGKNKPITFSFNELLEKLNLAPKYLDSWIQMALELGIFELENPAEKNLKIAPHVYELLIDKNNMVYIGGLLAGTYMVDLMQQPKLFECFKTGQIIDLINNDFPEDLWEETLIISQNLSAIKGKALERIYSKNFKEHKKNLRKAGAILEVGCGCGYTLEHWAKKFKKNRLVGIDIDLLPLEYCKSLIQQSKLNDRVEIHATTTNKYCLDHKNQFDLIILSEVLHEMDPDEQYRINALTDMYNLLKDNGILLISENMVPDTFTPKTRFQFFEVCNKWFETMFPSSFYNEESIEELFKSTPFKTVELVRDGRDYCCVAKKQPALKVIDEVSPIPS